MKIEWGEIGKCNRCGKPATTYFKKEMFLKRFERYFCQRCLLEVLREQRIEKTKVELVR
jgi:hypothetical protein